MNSKLSCILDLTAANGFDGAALIPSPNFLWLTGTEKYLMERPTVMLLSNDGRAALVIAGFELGSMSGVDLPFEAFTYGDDPATWTDAFRKAGAYLGLDGKKIAVEPIHFRFHEYSMMKEALPGCEVTGAPSLFAQLRLHKNDDEIANMVRASQISTDALEATLAMVKPGVTERQICSELVNQMMRRGADSNLAFNPVVGSGPHTADPHHEVSDRELQRGDFLLVDWGARFNGYCADLTRTFVIGEASDKQIDIYNTVLAANRAGLAAVKPGVTAGSLDDAARKVISDKGYGEYFTHRLGHGLGLEEHEDPYIFGGNEVLLEKGMVFSDEPGIYIDGWGGVRIEDDVVVTDDAGKTLSDYGRELRVL